MSEVTIDDIIGVRIDRKTGDVICGVKDSTNIFCCRQVVYSGREAKIFMHWYRQQVESRDDPEDCWEHCFVLNKHGVFDNDKVEEMIESAKKRRQNVGY